VIRRTAAAGSFYPADPGDLAAAVDALLDGASAPGPDDPRPLALVVPHAGYAYSGAIAAEGYGRIRGLDVRRVVVLGPAHFAPLLGAAAPAASAWATPLEPVEVDDRLRDAAIGAGAVAEDRPHRPEHAIEVQLPFLLRALGSGWTFLPVAVGRAAPGAVADLLEPLAELADLVVVSTDLSHYLDDASARELDGRTADAIVRLDPEGVGADGACGRHPLRGLLAFAARRGWTARPLRLGTSADATGDVSSVVGYGAFAFA
jgi:AmmeMemoRadiSam system protein B